MLRAGLVKKIKPDKSRTLYPSTSPRKAAAPLRAGVGGIYEVDKSSDSSVTGTKTYYPAAGATLAPALRARRSAGVRDGSTLYYVLKDHVGSASVVTDADPLRPSFQSGHLPQIR